jgi:two-component system, OmpR family, sensor kinase
MTTAATPSWYKSLYWRVALGLFAFLAIMLAAEAALFLWTSDRIAGSMPARSPRRLAVLVASDVGAALTADPQLDLRRYVDEQYGHVFQTFVIVMRDGRVVANHDDVPPRFAEPRFDDRGEGPDREGRDERNGPGPGPRRPPRGRPPFGRDAAPIVVDGMIAGVVSVVPGGPPFQRVVRELGPTMALMAGAVLAVGTTLIALFVFGPARRRLRQVQDATERLGGGDLSARAPDQGGDEVAALARSFNRMADELATRAQALAAADKARRQLLADVSHELMTPLTAMRGYIETLAMPHLHLDTATRERYVGIVTDETHRLERIIGDLLDLARLEGGGTAMRRERVAVSTLFDRVASRHEREMDARGIRLERDVEPGAEQVLGDPDRLEQALQNLAANALRHTPDGGAIHLNAAASADGVRITVRDTGTGIAPEHLPLIFDRFYKVDASRKASGGSGLGLSIVKTIVERHGGTIDASNHPDGGAMFTITLPTSTK